MIRNNTTDGRKKVDNAAIGWMLLAGFYFLTRLWNLRAFPLFIDEGVYLWYAENLLKGDLLRGLGEGKPLIGWIIAVPLATGMEPIWSARLPHVAAGFVGFVAATWLANQLFGRRVAQVTGFICVILPSLLFLERLATPDIVVGALGTLAISLTIAHFRRPRRWLAAMTGGVLILTVLAKSPVGLFFLLPPLLILWAERAGGSTVPWRRLVEIYVLPVLFVAAATAVVARRIQLGVQPVGFGLHEVIAKTGGGLDIAARLSVNLPHVMQYVGVHVPWPFAMLFLVASLAAILQRQPMLRALCVIVWLWVLAITVTTGFWADRYLAPVLYIGAVATAWALIWLSQIIAQWLNRRLPSMSASGMESSVLAGILLALLLSTAATDTEIMTHFSDSPIATPYLSGFGSGVGLAAAAAFLDGRIEGANGNAQVITLHVSDYTRLRAYATDRLRDHIRQVHIVDGQNQDFAGQVRHLNEWRSDADLTYLVVESALLWGDDWQRTFPEVTTVARFPKQQDEVLVLLLARQ